MAAIVITAANIAYVSGPLASDQIAGGAFIAGNVVYKADNGTWLKAQGDGSTVEAGANDLGVALFTADAAGARGSIATSGAVVAFGVVLTAGLFYIIGDTAGSIYPSADAGTADKVTLLGLAISTSQLLLQRIYHAGAVIA
jgi:hypothetical protein